MGLLVLLINNYIGNVSKTIKSDGEGYYDYLPSLFIYHDLVRKDIPVKADTILYQRLKTLPYIGYKDYKINKYPCGAALLEFPFFITTYFATTRGMDPDDGYQLPFQKTIFHSALFYLFLSILFLKQLLKQYGVKKYVITWIQLLMVMSTGVTNYVNFDAGFSHVYSLFAITAFLYFSKSFFINQNKVSHFLMACACLGLVILIRQFNIIVVLYIPFIAGSYETLKSAISDLCRRPKILVAGAALFASVSFMQCILWYLQTGDFLLDSYQNEGFDFSHPHLFDILFSYKKGLFIYTPILFFCLLALLWLLVKKQYYMVSSWLGFMLLLTYILSAWHSWSFGASYGLRAYIDYYALFFIPYAIMLNNSPTWLKSVIIGLSFFTMPLNLIQTYQYKEFILHWSDMDEVKYWRIFLKTGDDYKGLVWKRQ